VSSGNLRAAPGDVGSPGDLRVAAAHASQEATLVAGVAGLVAGALSMAAGEFVSVSSQRDAENADAARETRELAADPKGELEELTAIYERRELAAALWPQCARALSEARMFGACK
jgi:vacuolar iron transporter family protein